MPCNEGKILYIYYLLVLVHVFQFWNQLACFIASFGCVIEVSLTQIVHGAQNACDEKKKKKRNIILILKFSYFWKTKLCFFFSRLPLLYCIKNGFNFFSVKFFFLKKGKMNELVTIIQKKRLKKMVLRNYFYFVVK